MTLRDYFVFVYLNNGVEYATKNCKKYATGKVLFSYGRRNSRYFKQRATCFMHKMGWWRLAISRNFIGIHKIPNTTADEIVKVFKVIDLKLLKQGNY